MEASDIVTATLENTGWGPTKIATQIKMSYDQSFGAAWQVGRCGGAPPAADRSAATTAPSFSRARRSLPSPFLLTHTTTSPKPPPPPSPRAAAKVAGVRRAGHGLPGGVETVVERGSHREKAAGVRVRQR